MDLFKQKNIKMADSLDFYCKCCKGQRKSKDKRRLHKTSRFRLSQLDKEIIKEWERL